MKPYNANPKQDPFDMLASRVGEDHLSPEPAAEPLPIKVAGVAFMTTIRVADGVAGLYDGARRQIHAVGLLPGRQH